VTSGREIEMKCHLFCPISSAYYLNPSCGSSVSDVVFRDRFNFMEMFAHGDQFGANSLAFMFEAHCTAAIPRPSAV
jgi:hypothetical protein